VLDEGSRPYIRSAPCSCDSKSLQVVWREGRCLFDLMVPRRAILSFLERVLKSLVGDGPAFSDSPGYGRLRNDPNREEQLLSLCTEVDSLNFLRED